MNILERSILWFSPRMAFRRQRARLAHRALLAYDAAKIGRRNDGWTTASTSGDTELQGALSNLRDRSRDLVRNNPYARRAINEITRSVVGTGIMPYPDTDSEPLNEQITEAFDTWSETCEPSGQHDFFGVQELLARECFEAGEVLVRFRQRRPDDGLKIPLQLQVLEADHLDTMKTTQLEGGYIVNGIEFDLLGRRRAYWLFPTHPGDTIGTRGFMRSMQSQRVPASEVVHLYRKDRPSASRGVPLLHAVITTMRNLGDYEDAELMRKGIEACIVAFVTQPDGVEGGTLAPKTEDSTGKRREAFEPGLVEYLRPGEDVRFNNPVAAGGYREYVTEHKRAIAAGADMTYERFGDLSTVNYSSYKAGDNSFWAACDCFRWLVFHPMALRPIWRRMIDTAFAAGEISVPDYRVTWNPPERPSVDPIKDTKALIARVRAGLTTWPQAVLATGNDPKKQLAEIETWNEMLDEAEVVLDTDPRVDLQSEEESGQNTENEVEEEVKRR